MNAQEYRTRVCVDTILEIAAFAGFRRFRIVCDQNTPRTWADPFADPFGNLIHIPREWRKWCLSIVVDLRGRGCEAKLSRWLARFYYDVFVCLPETTD